MPFVTPLNSRLLVETNEILLLTPFVYECPRFKMRIVAPKDFISNGASIPRFLWPIFGHPFHNENIEPAVIHDFTYRYYYNILTRLQCDKMFYDGLILRKNSCSAAAMYVGVRRFAGPAWDAAVKDGFTLDY